jgi:hypothetical protein
MIDPGQLDTLAKQWANSYTIIDRWEYEEFDLVEAFKAGAFAIEAAVLLRNTQEDNNLDDH